MVHSHEGWWPEDFYDMDDVKPLCHPYQTHDYYVFDYNGCQPWLVPMLPHRVCPKDSELSFCGPQYENIQYPGASPLQIVASIDGQQSGLDDFVRKNPDHEIAIRVMAHGADLYREGWQALADDREINLIDDATSKKIEGGVPSSSYEQTLQRLRVTSMSTESTNERSPVFEDPGSPQSTATSIDDTDDVDLCKIGFALDAFSTVNTALSVMLESTDQDAFTRVPTQHHLMQVDDNDAVGDIDISRAQNIRYNTVIQLHFSIVDHCLGKDIAQHHVVRLDDEDIKNISPADVWTASDFRFDSEPQLPSIVDRQGLIIDTAKNPNDHVEAQNQLEDDNGADEAKVEPSVVIHKGFLYVGGETDVSYLTIYLVRPTAPTPGQGNTCDAPNMEDLTFPNDHRNSSYLNEDRYASCPATPARHIIRPGAPTPGRGHRTFLYNETSPSSDSVSSFNSETDGDDKESGIPDQHTSTADPFADVRSTSGLLALVSDITDVTKMRQINPVLRPKPPIPFTLDVLEPCKEFSDPFDDENQFDEELFTDDDGSSIFNTSSPESEAIRTVNQMPMMHGAIDALGAESTGLKIERCNYIAPWFDDGDDEDGLVTVRKIIDSQSDSSNTVEVSVDKSSSDPDDEDAAWQQSILDSCFITESVHGESADNDPNQSEPISPTYLPSLSSVRLEPLFRDLIGVINDIRLDALEKLTSQQWDPDKGIVDMWNFHKFVYAKIPNLPRDKVFKYPDLVNFVDHATNVAVQLKIAASVRLAEFRASRHQPPVRLVESAADVLEQQIVLDKASPNLDTSLTSTTTDSKHGSISNIVAQAAINATRKSVCLGIDATLLGPRLGWKIGKKSLSLCMAGLGLRVKLGKYFLPTGA